MRIPTRYLTDVTMVRTEDTEKGEDDEGESLRRYISHISVPDVIFVTNFTRPAFLGPKFYTKKCVNRDNAKFTTNQRKCFKMPLLLALVTKFHQ